MTQEITAPSEVEAVTYHDFTYRIVEFFSINQTPVVVHLQL